MNDLERRYRLLLLAFPRHYRTERGDELVGTLMEGTGHRRRPSAADVGDLLLHAVRVRLGIHRARPARGGLAMTAGIALSLSAALSLVAMLFGELPVWGRDPGLIGNQFGFGPFETTGVFAYVLVLAAWLFYLAGWTGAARAFAGLACLAVLGSCLAALSVRDRPNLTVLATLVVCLAPLLFAQGAASRHRSVVAVVPIAGALLGVVAFAGFPTGHPRHWDPRERFYTDQLGLIGRLHPVVALLALAVLAVGAATAWRLRRHDVWVASTLVVVPSMVLALGGGYAGARVQDRLRGNAPFFQMAVLMALVVAAELAMARRRGVASDGGQSPATMSC